MAVKPSRAKRTIVGVRKGLFLGTIVTALLAGLLAATPAGANTGLVSDEFSSGSLGSHWTLFDPIGDASVTATGSHVDLSVPAGVSHNLWTNQLNAPRLLQDANDDDLELEIKIDSPISQKYQLQGLVVQQDNGNLVRVDVYHTGSKTKLFAATFTNGKATAKANIDTTMVAPYWLRLNRTADLWTFSASDDGTNWTTVTSFTHALTVNQAGIFAGNHNPSPAHTASFDYFRVS